MFLGFSGQVFIDFILLFYFLFGGGSLSFCRQKVVLLRVKGILWPNVKEGDETTPHEPVLPTPHKPCKFTQGSNPVNFHITSIVG